VILQALGLQPTENQLPTDFLRAYVAAKKRYRSADERAKERKKSQMQAVSPS
jgi:hypothetical protein